MDKASQTVDDENLSFDDFDELNFPRPEMQDFDEIVERAISRRGFLSGSVVIGTAAFLIGTSTITSSPARATGRFGFKAIAANTLDTITLPQGYKWQTVAKWGDPMWSDAPDFNHLTRGTAASQARAFGDNNDGMALFQKDGKNILACNNEYTNTKVMFGNRDSQLPENEDDIIKSMNAHGISVVEITEEDGRWEIIKDSPFNRRITPITPMEITGPARGHDLMRTSADPDGTTALGTWNNCGNGRTPWDTYLACEENFNAYFTHPDKNFKPKGALKRYGVGARNRGLGWEKIESRFDITKEPNECNRAGYIVEIDPMDPTSTPKKRTALGRLKHENAEVVIAANGHIVVYMGDDERGEYLYRFVSSGKYTLGGDNSNLLDDGTLYAALFNDDQTGKWLALTPQTTGMESLAKICIHTRQAASKVKATTMDRPEWVAANPNKVEAYCALTNNKNRGIKANAGGDETPLNGVNPRKANQYGQIVRWEPDNGDHTAEGFKWDLFVLAGNPTVKKGLEAGSQNINASNMFNSPDGIAFDSKGFLWIQTDGKYSNEGDFIGMGNNQMLVGDTETSEIRRFLVGPREAEITGVTWTADRKTMFVGIQHPGERGKGDSHFPDGGDTIPRSAVIAITREDGGLIG